MLFYYNIEAHVFYPFSGHYLAKKIQNFLKWFKSNTTLPFVFDMLK